MEKNSRIIANLDWITILIYLTLVFMGWFNIYAATFDETHESIFDFSKAYGKQLVWIIAAFGLAFVILLLDSKFFTAFSMVIYGITIMLLICVLLFGKEVHGSRSWFELGGIRLQPAEFAKFATSLALAYVMSRHNFNFSQWKNMLLILIVLALPAGLIKLQNDTGSAMVYGAFILVLFREGLHGSSLLMIFMAMTLFFLSLLSPELTVLLFIIAGTAIAFYYYHHRFKDLFWALLLIATCFLLFYVINLGLEGTFSMYVLLLMAYAVCSLMGMFIIYYKKWKRSVAVVLLVSWLCIGFSASVDYVYDHLKPHQKERIDNYLGIADDPSGSSYNVLQSKIAIGSGGLLGKGYLQGTQTRLSFVPEQSTDFIFCTVGEEWGFVGSSLVIFLFTFLMLRMIHLAERQRSPFSRIYGYGVVSLLFFHTAVNIGMTIGLIPVVGIPLPFFSYGGSSLWSFTILIFIFLRLDANRLQIFR